MSGNLTQATFQRAMAAVAGLPAMDDGPLYLRLHTGPPPPESPVWQVLGTVAGPQPWARHEREHTMLELAIVREMIASANRYAYVGGFDDDETASDATVNCASSSGGRWSDLMAQIDNLIEERP